MELIFICKLNKLFLSFFLFNKTQKNYNYQNPISFFLFLTTSNNSSKNMKHVIKNLKLQENKKKIIKPEGMRV
jgi:hypothetical protein